MKISNHHRFSISFPTLARYGPKPNPIQFITLVLCAKQPQQDTIRPSIPFQYTQRQELNYYYLFLVR